MFIIMPIIKVNWSYTESAWQNYVNTRALHLSRNNPGMLLQSVGRQVCLSTTLTVFTTELWDSPESNIHSKTLGS